MRWSPSSMTAWIICSSSASRMPCSPPRSTRIDELLGAHHALRPASPAPSIRATAVVIAVRTRDERPEDAQQDLDEAAQAERERSAWARARLLGTSSPKTIVNRLRSRVTMISASAPADVARTAARCPRSSVSRLVGQVDRRVGRGEEAEEGQADLGDRQEAARLRDQALDPRRALVALVDELVDARPADRDEGDLGRRRRRPRAGSG